MKDIILLESPSVITPSRISILPPTGSISYTDLKTMADSIKEGSLVELMLHPMYDENGTLTDSKIVALDEVDSLLDRIRAERQAYYLV